MALFDAQIAQQQGQRFGFHWFAIIAMQHQLLRPDVLAGGSGNELFGQFRTLPLDNHPADNETAEGVENGVQGKMRPFGRSA